MLYTIELCKENIKFNKYY